MESAKRIIKLYFVDNTAWLLWPIIGFLVVSFFGFILLLIEGVEEWQH